jgi:hypothetical protein
MAAPMFARVSSSTAARGILAVMPILSVAAAVKAVVETNKSNTTSVLKIAPESAANKDSTRPPPLRGSHRRNPWLRPMAISFSTHNRIHRGGNLIGWYKDGSEVEQDITLRVWKNHNIAVVKYLNEQFYLHLPRSLGAPCQLDVHISPRRLSDAEQALNIISIADLKNTVVSQLEQRTAPTHQLLLTNAPDVYAPAPTEQHAHLILINKPTLPFDHRKQHTNYLSKIAKSVLARLYNDAVVDNVHFSFLLQFGKAPEGFENCLSQGEAVVPLEPHQEPLLFDIKKMKKPLRINAPVFDYWGQKAYQQQLRSSRFMGALVVTGWEPVNIGAGAVLQGN